MSAFIRLGTRIIVIAAVLGVALCAAYASQITGSTFGTFTTGGIDLKIDSKSWYNGQTVPSATWAMKNLTPTADKFFNYPDVKPGDFGCEVISMHVQKGEAWLCLDFKNLSSKDNSQNEPESISDPNGATKGELADNLQFFGWIDNGDNAYKPGERIIFGTSTKAASTVLNGRSYAVGDFKNGNSCRQNESRYVGMCWCAGVLTVNMQTGKMTCDGSKLGNIAQTDSVTLDVAIRALSSTGDPKFLCSPETPSTPPHRCEKDKWGQWKDEKGKNCIPEKNVCEKDPKGRWKDAYGKDCKHVPETKNDCKNDGWKSCKDQSGKDFKTQNECNNYVDSKKDTPRKNH